MENFTFWTPTRYVFGRGVENKAGELTAQMLGTRILLVSGGHSAEASGLLGRVRESLTQAGVTFEELKGIRPNPTDDKVREGIAMMRSGSLTGLLAVGGGSVIDTAKAIAAGVPYDGDFWDFFAGKATITEALPLGTVLTIPAAGSEGSGNSVITRMDGMVKISIRTEKVLRPKFSLMNPELTYTLPAFQTACGVADMMAHIFERYFSTTTGTEVTDRVAEGLLMAIINEAPKLMATPDDYDARANVMWSGTLAHNGICGTGRKEDWASHAMEHEVSAVYDVAHGAGLAVIMPAWMTFVARKNPQRGAQLARRVFGIHEASDFEAAEQGIMALKLFFSKLKLPVTFAQLGIPQPDIKLLVTRLHANKGVTIGGYVPLTAAETTEIYRLAL